MILSTKNITVLLSILFVGFQMMAVSNRICMMHESDKSHSMTMMDHSSHHMSQSQNQSKPDNENCCDDRCNCTIGSCSSVFISNPIVNNLYVEQSSVLIGSFNRFVPLTENSLLYRPPIFS